MGLIEDHTWVKFKIFHTFSNYTWTKFKIVHSILCLDQVKEIGGALNVFSHDIATIIVLEHLYDHLESIFGVKDILNLILCFLNLNMVTNVFYTFNVLYNKFTKKIKKKKKRKSREIDRKKRKKRKFDQHELNKFIVRD